MNRRFDGVARHGALAVALSLLVGAALAHAQEEKTQRLRMEPLVVEAPPLFPERSAGDETARREIERVPGGVAIVAGEAAREARAANLKDALDFVPGVMVRPRFGAADESQLSVRGSGLRNNFHLRGINVLLDGFSYGNADGFSDFESLELLSTKRLEVYKGANALRFGAGSLGGALNLVSKTGQDVGPIELTSEGGSFGYHKHYVGSGREAGPWDAYVGLSNTELEGFREHSEQTRRRGFATVGRSFTGGSVVRVDLGYVRNQEDLPGSLTEEELDDDPEQADAESIAADSRRDYDYARGALSAWMPIDDQQSIEGSLQANLQDLFHPLAFAVLTGDTWSWGADTRYRRLGRLFGKENRLTIGAQYGGSRQEDVRFEAIGDARKGEKTRDQINEAYNLGGYAESQLAWTEALSLVVGGRLQYADRSLEDERDGVEDPSDDSTDFFAFSPKVGFVWRVHPTLDVQVYGNASHAYEPPLLLELAAPQDLAGSFDDLEAQKAWQFEIGTRGRFGRRFAWDLSVYDIELEDEILNLNVQPFPGAPFTIPRYRNVDRSRHTGVEVGGDFELARGIARSLTEATPDRLNLRLAYTWSRFVFVDDDEFGDNDLPGAPTHYLRSELRYETGNGFWIAPGMEAVPEGYAVDSVNQNETDAYALFGVRGGYRHAAWNLDLFVEGRNLLDESYVSSVQVDSGNLRFFEPGDGRAFYGGVRWSWS